MGLLREYIHLWQLPIFVGFLAAWVLGCGYLLLRAIRPHLPRRKATLSRCAVSMLLTGLASGFAMVATIYVYVAIAKPANMREISPGIVLGALAAVPMAILVLYTAFNLPFRRTVRSVAPAVGVGFALALATAVAAFLPAHRIRLTKIHQDHAVHRLRVIRGAINTFAGKNAGRLPKDFNELVAAGSIKPEALKSRTNLARDVGFFYLPAPSRMTQDPDRILVCDFRDNHGGRWRAVAFSRAKKDAGWFSETDFQELLEKDANADFATALRAAEDE